MPSLVIPPAPTRSPSRLASLRGVLAACVLAAAAATGVQAAEADYEPVIGQPGKDVVWVPTPDAAVEAMLDLAALAPGDVLVDLGSGDGRIVLAAARRGVRALGVDLNEELVALARSRAEELGLADRARFVVRDLFDTDLSGASVVTLYLLPHLNLRLRPMLLSRLRPGARVLTHAFHMGEWQPDAVRRASGIAVHLWIVPAAAMGHWQWRDDGVGYPRDYDMRVRQDFQFIAGSASSRTGFAYLRDMTLRGAQIRFTMTEEAGSALSQTAYEGTIDGDAITGTARTNGGAPRAWNARRIGGATAIDPRDASRSDRGTGTDSPGRAAAKDGSKGR